MACALSLTATSSRGEKSGEIHAITGGGGYVGYHIGMQLTRLGYRVKLLDLRPKPYGPLQDGMTYDHCDILNFANLKNLLTGVSCVFHVASYGMSGREQYNRLRTELVNVGGTENVIRACKAVGVERLVYTSTYNVVFGGQEIRNGDESLPYFPPENHPDHYSRTKTFAEQSVLAANNRKSLRTCALRLAGVYGPGEERHLPRAVRTIRRGLFCVVYGDPKLRVDFLHVDNLVAAHVGAAEALREGGPAAGQVYFISDGAPINNFEFFRPLVEGLGYSFPSLRVPFSLIYAMAFLMELLHTVIGSVCPFQPLLTRAEVFKTGVTHFFSIEKARRELQYEPTVQNDLTGVVKLYRQEMLEEASAESGRTFFSAILTILVGLAFTAVVMSFIPRAN